MALAVENPYRSTTSLEHTSHQLPCYSRLLWGESFSSEGASSMACSDRSIQDPLPGQRDLYPTAAGGDGVVRGWGGGDLGVPPPPRSQSPNLKMAKQLSQHLWRAPCARHELDMETTCICIHVTAGFMSPSQPRPMTERLLF